jgi:EH domain-containing protein 1
MLVTTAALMLSIGTLPLVSSSLGPLSMSQFSIRKQMQRRISMRCLNDDVPIVELSNFIDLRGGNADYIGDDESSWNDGQPEMQPQSDQQMYPRHDSRLQSQNPGQNPYGSGAPWQQNNRPSFAGEQQSWGGSQPNDLQNQNPDVRFGSQDMGRDEPQLPGSPERPMYRGHPQHQQHYPQGRLSGQQQQHPHSQGMYPPPPNLPGYGKHGRGHQLPASHPSMRVQNAHLTSQGMAPPGYDEEDDDDWLPFNGDNVDDVRFPTESPQSGESGGMDLSQFDKDVIFNGLKRLYRKKIRPLEISSKYGHFHSPPLSPSDFDAKPMVLLLGQYSVGKTSFIRYLLGRDFPGQRIGPEPTTDRFVAIIKGESGDKVIPGAALCSQADRPFRGLSPFGNNFLSRFEGVEMDSPILNNITLVDTPGILSGQKQMIGRNYDYEQVMKWFAERADLIIIMFDAHKLDISDELKRVIELLKPHQDKMRVLLNKADSISTQQLMRVYGALMWSLGKVMMTPEVCRVYMGSFWGAPLKNKEQAALLTQEKLDLFNDIAQLPQNAVMRRINELVKRARSVKVHAYIIHYLRKQLPYTWGKREKQRRLIDRLDREFVMCARRYELPRGDFPEMEPFRQALLEIKDLSEIHKLDKKMVKEMDKVFSIDIPNLLEAAKYQ